MFAQMGQEIPETPLILEVNPEHAMIQKLDKLENETTFADMAWILLDLAKLSEGLEPKNKAEFSARIARVATEAL